jgi:putative tryptophan/tyrosine transport system substrate-binding protein
MSGLKHWCFGAMLLIASGVLAQPGMPRIGWVLSGTSENSRHLVEAIRRGLADEGLVDGRNVTLDLRFNAGRSEGYAENFANLTRSAVSVLAASGYAGISAARDASGGRIPVAAYFCGNDVKQMVESFARPGGNITGVSCLSAELATKRVELLKDALPTLRRIGFLYDPRSPGKETELAETDGIARTLGMTVASAAVTAAQEFKDAIASLRRGGAEALVISEDAFTFSNRAQIVALTAEQGMVDISAFREFVVAGGVMSYGANAAERLRHQARYAARMARGVPPSELPIDQPTRFEFVVNVRAAHALGVTIPRIVLVRADEVIE